MKEGYRIAGYQIDKRRLYNCWVPD